MRAVGRVRDPDIGAGQLPAKGRDVRGSDGFGVGDRLYRRQAHAIENLLQHDGRLERHVIAQRRRHLADIEGGCGAPQKALCPGFGRARLGDRDLGRRGRQSRFGLGRDAIGLVHALEEGQEDGAGAGAVDALEQVHHLLRRGTGGWAVAQPVFVVSAFPGLVGQMLDVPVNETDPRDRGR